MNAKKILAAVLVGATALGAVAPIASAATITPAAYADGFVTAVDARAGTFMIGQTTYTLRSPAQLQDVTAGSEVDVAYVLENGRRTVIAVTPIEDVEGDLVD